MELEAQFPWFDRHVKKREAVHISVSGPWSAVHVKSDDCMGVVNSFGIGPTTNVRASKLRENISESEVRRSLGEVKHL